MSDILDTALLRQGVPTHPLDLHISAVRRLECEARRAADQIGVQRSEIERLRESNADLMAALLGMNYQFVSVAGIYGWNLEESAPYKASLEAIARATAL